MIIYGDIQWPMVSAIAASTGVIVALVFYTLNLRSTRLSNSARMVLDLLQTFNSDEMRGCRRSFATRLLDKNSPVDVRRDVPVLEFFEQVGYLTRRKVLDEGMVWNCFFWSLELYFLAVTRDPNLIATAREENKSPSLFQEIEWLYSRLCKVDMKEESAVEHIPPHSDYVRLFLEEESKLKVQV
ncbi:MAG TPA: hypothetical protein VHE60_09955 [Pyrinomonadaceae bacterium]|nr:hypothetical protein [Pyrinomonadaceae bacterium]